MVQQAQTLLPHIDIVDAIIYVVACSLITTIPILVKMFFDSRHSKKAHEKNGYKLKENSDKLDAITNYICDKGVDDFNDECDEWIAKDYITKEAYFRLKCRYDDLEPLGANGRRERHWNKINEMKKQGKIKDK